MKKIPQGLIPLGIVGLFTMGLIGGILWKLNANWSVLWHGH